MERKSLYLGRETRLPEGSCLGDFMRLTEKEELARKRVCLPLDGLHTLQELETRVSELHPVVGMFKVGMESYTRFGPKAVETVLDNGADVFLDLKYKDIPATVEGASEAAAALGVYMFNLHADGGNDMMKAAVRGAKKGAAESGQKTPKILGVTVLTSIDDRIMNEELGIPGHVKDQVLRYSGLCLDSGLDGIVCSGAELSFITEKLPEKFMYVIPGISGPNVPAGSDQKRVYTPGRAIHDGASILVVGRAITSPKTREERLLAGYEILKDMVPYI